MCDYSLQGIDSRLAVEGERLVVHRFRTGSIGMTSENDLRSDDGAGKCPWYRFLSRPARPAACAVCIPPGARLLLHDIPGRIQRELAVGPVEEVVFTELTAETNAYRDAVRFRTGAELLLQRLEVGQAVDLLSLGVPETTASHSGESETAGAIRWLDGW